VKPQTWPTRSGVPPLSWTQASDELEHALSLMRERQVRRLPVLKGVRLVGIVAQADVAALVEPGLVADTLRELSEPAATEAARRRQERR
jgi:CBS domain-containing protein